MFLKTKKIITNENNREPYSITRLKNSITFELTLAKSVSIW